MAQKSNSRRKAPVYSGDTLALRGLAGLALVALGAVIFLAVDLRMSGNIFDGLRNLCYGLTGGLAAVLAVWPLWAGVLVFWSTQRKAPVRPFLYALLAFMGLSAFIVLVTRYGGESFLAHLTGSPARTWGDVIQNGFRESIVLKQSGGALGILLAWPLWQVLGEIPAAGIVLILTLLCVLLAVNLAPSRIWGLMTGKVSFRRQQTQESRDQAAQAEIAWQQQQARQQAQMQPGAPYFQGTQPGAPYAQPAAAQPGTPYPQPEQGRQPVPQGSGGYAAQTGRQTKQPTEINPGLEAWQDHLNSQVARTGDRQDSRIFGRKPHPAETSGEEKPRKSRIFKKADEEDGLTDPEAVAQRRTAAGREGKKPGTQQTAPDRDEDGLDLYRQTGRKARENRAAEERREPVFPSDRKAREERTVRREPEFGEEASRAGNEDKGSVWGRQLEVAMNRASEEEEKPAAEAPRKEKKPPEEAPKKVPVPNVTPIGEETWKPELKGIGKRTEDEEEEEAFWTPTPYYAPPITDLQMPKPNLENTAEEDEMRSRRLEETLASFRVQARVVNVTHGPAISRFELELASGTKVNKVAELEKDIAYGMEATSVRIEAPIPGKGLVGVEVPNRKVETVTLREVLESAPMQKAKSVLTVALGKDIAGTPIICDLAKMPHVLIAGATGSGKSVCINTIINSLLYRAGPEEVRMILIDPKVVELQVYNGIPHLLIPVVNDPHKASAALAWAVAEMMERYDQFAQAKVRNMDGYNAQLEPGQKPMPRIVIIIDELADLMMVCKKDVEEYIVRLTQLARAAGIHLIVATQRPSVDVITGLIKANIPSRIAFKTASYVDSRTILDRNGSEQLLGYGDMLYLPTGSFAPTRLQGCYLSDDEVNRIAADVKRANPSTYDPDILDKLEQISNGSSEAPGPDMIGGAPDSAASDNGLFEQAVEFAIADGQISTSTLQRRLKVGYARAGRLTDEMEERGIVSAKDGSKPRKCLITREQWEEMKNSTEGMI